MCCFSKKMEKDGAFVFSATNEIRERARNWNLVACRAVSQGRADQAVNWTTFSRSAGIGLCDIHCEADFLIKKESSLRRTFSIFVCPSKRPYCPFGGLSSWESMSKIRQKNKKNTHTHTHTFLFLAMCAYKFQ